MTRDEELQQQAMSLIGFSKEVSREDAIKLAYYFGAKYADETMLDKVCKWLKENVRVFQKEDIADFILANLRKEMMK